METPPLLPERCRFAPPVPNGRGWRAVILGASRLRAISSRLRELDGSLAEASTAELRERFLDAAASCAHDAERHWRAGRVVEALALEGLEGRLMEALLFGPD